VADAPTMLDGIRVLDLSRAIAGPYCAALMADLGADVVKVERPGRGDDLHAWRGSGMSATFAAINRGKRGIAVDLQQPEGGKLVFELARRADVVVENFLPGVADKLGLGYTAVSAVNPAAVYVSVTGFGQDGPHARRAGYNTIAQGMSGIMALTGMPGHPPTKVGGSVSDLAAAFLAFGVASAALAHRLRTGRGQHLDVSLLASTLALLPHPVAHYFDSGQRPARVGNRNPYLSPAEAFRRFGRALGEASLTTDPMFVTNDARVANHDEFKARVERALSRETTAVWVARFETEQVAAGPIYEFDEVFEDAQVQHLGLVKSVEQPGYGTARMLDFPVRASATPGAIRRPAPRLGEHTAEVLTELGLPPSEIERLAAAGVIALA